MEAVNMLQITLNGRTYRIHSIKTLSDGKRTRMAEAEFLAPSGQWKEVKNWARLEQLAHEYDKRQDIHALEKRVEELRNRLMDVGYTLGDLHWLEMASDWAAQHDAEQFDAVELVKEYRKTVNDFIGAAMAQTQPVEVIA
jgi:hypothetical protein